MLKLLTGRSGTGKTAQILTEITEKLNQGNMDRMILFVPEQMSFQAEYEIVKRLSSKSYTNLQVLSFKRLGYRLFLELGGKNRMFINDLVVNMMIAKIIEMKKPDFQLYKNSSAKLNFIELVRDVIKEFKTYQVTPETLKRLNADNATLTKKLHDITVIYEELLKLYGGKLLDNEDFYEVLGNLIKDSNYLSEAEIYIDGYHSFSNVELFVVKNLIKYCKNVTILFTIGDLGKPHRYMDEDSLFNLPYKTIEKIRQFVNEEKIPMEMTHLNRVYRFNKPALAFLEAAYETDAVYHNSEGIVISECLNPAEEVHHAARTIFNAVYKNKRSYSDFVIYTNNQELYYPLIQNIFRLYEIPLFIDDRKLMLDHSLLNFIDAVLEVVASDRRYEAVFRAVKTEMFMNIREVNTQNYDLKVNEYRHRLDVLENYCLSHGITGQDWEKDYWELNIHKKLSDHGVKKDEDIKIEQAINETKMEIAGPLNQFITEFKESQNVREQVTAIYNLLERLDVQEKLELYEALDEKTAVSARDLNDAKKHKQVYNQVSALFSELVEVCGDYTVSTDELIKILQTGFKSLTFAIVPPAIDQVMVGSLKRSRFEMMNHFDDAKAMGIKAAFVIGVNENEMPKIYSDSGLISSKERAILLEKNVEVMPTAEKLFLDDQFIIYTVLTSASDELHLSYTLSNGEKREAFRSEIIDKLLIKFPDLKIKTIPDFPGNELEDNFSYITSVNITSSLLLKAVNLLHKGYDVHEMWKALYGYFRNDKALSLKLSGVGSKNIAKTLTPGEVDKLYPDAVNASVSAIERYNSCPYAYFLERGLAIKERDIQKVEAMDIGDLYHETLKEITRMLLRTKKELHEIPPGDIHRVIDTVVARNADKMQRHFFSINSRNAYLLNNIKASLVKSLEVMRYQSSHSAFHIFAAEEPFGKDAEKLKMPEIMLSSGKRMNVKGFIDRIDVAYIGNTPYVRIIDYKSGNRDIDFAKIYNRLSLQLFTYLDVVLRNSKALLKEEAKAAGVLYYHIHNSEITAEGELTAEEVISKHQEAYQMNGYTLESKDVSILHDDKLTASKKSDIIKVILTNTGYHKTNAKVLSETEIRALCDYTEKSLAESAERLTRGEIPIMPVMYNKEAACKYCLYRSICKFDPHLRENRYKEIEKSGDAKEIIAQIEAELEGEKN